MKRILIAIALTVLVTGCSSLDPRQLFDPRGKVSVEVVESKGLLSSTYEVTLNNRNTSAVNCAVKLVWKTDSGSESRTVNIEVPAVGAAQGKVDPPAAGGTPTVQLESCAKVK
jgi:hypothetical protein